MLLLLLLFFILLVVLVVLVVLALVLLLVVLVVLVLNSSSSSSSFTLHSLLHSFSPSLPSAVAYLIGALGNFRIEVVHQHAHGCFGL